jgi:dihydroxy-acid dehydratase
MEGGAIALVHNGDRIRIDAGKNLLEVLVSDADLEKRRAAWKKPPYRVQSGYLWKYIKNVASASDGCLTDL